MLAEYKLCIVDLISVFRLIMIRSCLGALVGKTRQSPVRNRFVSCASASHATDAQDGRTF